MPPALAYHLLSSLMPPRKSSPAAPISTRPRRTTATQASAPSTKSPSKTITKGSAPKATTKSTRAKASPAPVAAKKGSNRNGDNVSTAVLAKEFRPVASALAMKIISAVQMEGGGEHVSDDEAHAAVEMATEALSQRIIAAVDEISNPKASAPKATKQLAARMAKVIVEAATSKADASSSAPRTSAFTNQHGEEWQLTVDAKGQKGILAGDETDWETLQITGDAVQSDFMFSKEELVWLRKAWKAATGRELKHPTMNVEQLLVQAGLLHKISPAPKRAATKKK